MEEFIKENKEEFLAYIKDEEALKESIASIDEQIKEENDVLEKYNWISGAPGEQIEKDKAEIMKLNIKIAECGIGKSNEEGHELDNYKINKNIAELTEKKQKLEKEVKEIIDACSKLMNAKEKLKELKSLRLPKMEELKNKTDKQLKIIEEAIQNRSNAIDEISKLREQDSKKEEEEIYRLENVLLQIEAEEIPENIKYVKDNAIKDMQQKIEAKKKRYIEKVSERDEAKVRNINELNGLKQLKRNLLNGNFKDTIYKELNMKEDNQEEVDENSNQKSGNGPEAKQLVEGRWAKDKQCGKWYVGYVPENMEEESLIQKIKGKIKSVFNKIVNKFTKNSYENVPNATEMNTDLSEERESIVEKAVVDEQLAMQNVKETKKEKSERNMQKSIEK